MTRLVIIMHSRVAVRCGARLFFVNNYQFSPSNCIKLLNDIKINGSFSIDSTNEMLRRDLNKFLYLSSSLNSKRKEKKKYIYINRLWLKVVINLSEQQQQQK